MSDDLQDLEALVDLFPVNSGSHITKKREKWKRRNSRRRSRARCGADSQGDSPRAGAAEVPRPAAGDGAGPPPPPLEASVAAARWPHWAVLPEEDEVHRMSIPEMRQLLRRLQADQRGLLTREEMQSCALAQLALVRAGRAAEGGGRAATAPDAAPPGHAASGRPLGAWRDDAFARYLPRRCAPGCGEEHLSEEERRGRAWVLAQKRHNVLFSTPYLPGAPAAEVLDEEELPPLEDESDGLEDFADMPPLLRADVALATGPVQETPVERIMREAREAEAAREVAARERRRRADEEEAARRKAVEEEVRRRKAQLEQRRAKAAEEALAHKLLEAQLCQWKAQDEEMQRERYMQEQLRLAAARECKRRRAARKAAAEAQEAASAEVGRAPPEAEAEDLADEASSEEENEEAKAQRVAELRRQIVAEERQRLEEERLGRIAERRRRLASAQERARAAALGGGSAAPGFCIPGMACPKNHPMVPYVKRVTGPCDECKSNIGKGTHVMACSFAPVCDWFLCRKCCEDWDRKRRASGVGEQAAAKAA